jgi:gamma-butyrobetaine dioxygenase
VVAVCDGGTHALPALWLRERSTGPDQIDAQTGQRLFDPHELPLDITLTGARMDGDAAAWLTFSDGFEGRFELAALRGQLRPIDGCPECVPWDAGLKALPVFDWSDAPSGPEHEAILRAFLTLGFVILKNCPTRPGSVLALAERFGHVRETNFGRMFEVRVRPGYGNDLAYSALHLGPHTDNPYRDPVPGIQLLLCARNEAEGGRSTFVDSLAVGAELKTNDPQAFELLKSTPVQFRFADHDTELVEWRPLIACDHAGRMTGVHFSPRLDYAPMMDPEDFRRFHKARAKLARMFADPRFELSFQLGPGWLVMFDNRRLLHGRHAYDPGSGERLLEGCYIDHDAPRSRYRVLRRAAEAIST